MIKCNCRLGLEGDLLGYAGFAPALTVRRPLLWQIQTMSHRQARMMICKRKGYGDLTIVLLASWPQYCRATPTECRPFLGKPVSSMIQAAIGPLRSIAGSTNSPTLASIAASDHAALPIK